MRNNKILIKFIKKSILIKEIDFKYKKEQKKLKLKCFQKWAFFRMNEKMEQEYKE